MKMARSNLGSNTALLLAAAAVSHPSSYSIGYADAFSGANNLRRSIDSLHERDTKWRWRPTRATILFQGQSIAMNETVSIQPKGEILSSDFTIDHGRSAPAEAFHHSNGLSNDSSLSSSSSSRVCQAAETVPSTWNQALHRFFLGDVGPPLVVLSILGFLCARVRLPEPFSIAEATIFASAVLFWWIQEYFFHRVLLHSPFDWVGKSIHGGHHDKDYFHVSIDPPGLLLGWLFAAHLAMKCALPWHLCLSATAGYALAGLGYEWTHYIVHTRVKPPSRGSKASAASRLFAQTRENHMRHHLVDDRYWYAFSVPAMDDLFDTNPDVREAREDQKKKLAP